MDDPSQQDRDRIAEGQRRLEALRAVTPRVHFEVHRPTRVLPSLSDAVARAMAAAQWVSDEEVARYEAERERERRVEWLYSTGVADMLTPEMVQAIADDRLEPTDALGLVRRWAAYQRDPAKGPKPILAIVGAMGRGKTVAAAWLVLHENARYIEAEEVCRLASARWGPERETWQRVQAARVLVVDEVGTEGDASTAAAAYRELLNRRQNGRPTLLLGNVSKADLRARLDARTWDRMRPLASIIELGGESLRRGEP